MIMIIIFTVMWGCITIKI